MAKVCPKHRPWTPQLVRDRIKATKIVLRMQRFVLEEIDPTTKKIPVMSMGQLRAAEILLRKMVPDLSAVQHSGQVIHRNVMDLTDEELADIARRRSAGTAETPIGPEEPTPVH